MLTQSWLGALLARSKARHASTHNTHKPANAGFNIHAEGRWGEAWRGGAGLATGRKRGQYLRKLKRRLSAVDNVAEPHSCFCLFDFELCDKTRPT